LLGGTIPRTPYTTKSLSALTEFFFYFLVWLDVLVLPPSGPVLDALLFFGLVALLVFTVLASPVLVFTVLALTVLALTVLALDVREEVCSLFSLFLGLGLEEADRCGVPPLAGPRIFVVTAWGIAATVLLSSWVTLVKVPAA
jgi:hypothetical protein